MKKSSLRQLEPGSADYVIAHADFKRKRGKRPSLPFCGVRNPDTALLFAMLTKKYSTEIVINSDGSIEHGLSADEYAGKYIAMLSFVNSFVVASGDDPKRVLQEAQSQGVERPVIVFARQEKEKLSINLI